MRDFYATASEDKTERTGAAISRSFLAAVALIATAVGLCQATAAMAAPLAPAQFNSLATACAPGVAPEILRSVASKESRFDPFALHDNTRKLTRTAADAKAATALAQAWIAAGDSVDVGLMQINAPNLPRLGLTVAQAFDACLSLAAGAAVLRDAYHQGSSQAEQQAALLIMLSRYNTGRPLAGLVNGYVGDVVGGPAHVAPEPSDQEARAEPVAAVLPDWDVWANATFAQTHGAAWLVNFPAPLSAPSKTTIATRTPTQKPQ